MEVTDGKGVDVAVELISLSETLEATSRCMGVGGRMVIAGFHGGSGFNLDARKVLRRELTVTGSRATSRSELQEAVRLLQQGMVKPVIGVRLPLEDANEGLEMDLANKVVGRAVLINA
jgi:D-arabinose 1-dehydrogenase-like Zn-dependent alcohol dehydrogenase